MKMLINALLFAFVQSASLGQPLDEGAVAAAIKAGESKKFKELVSECSAKPGFGSAWAGNMGGGVQPTGRFDVIVSAAPGRIALMAADAKRLYKPFSATDVPAETRANATVFVTVIPNKPDSSGKGILVASPIERVVLRGQGETIVQPSDVQLAPEEWSNLVGGKVHANSAVATFEAGAVRALPAGDIDIVVITAAGERRCKIGQSDRTKVLR